MLLQHGIDARASSSSAERQEAGVSFQPPCQEGEEKAQPRTNG